MIYSKIMELQHATAQGILLQKRRKPSQTAKMSPRLPTTPTTALARSTCDLKALPAHLSI